MRSFVSKGVEERGRRENHQSSCFFLLRTFPEIKQGTYIEVSTHHVRCKFSTKTPQLPPLPTSNHFIPQPIHHIPTRPAELGPSLSSPSRSAPGKEKYDVRGCSCVSTFKHGLRACAKPPLLVAHNWRRLESPRVTFQERRTTNTVHHLRISYTIHTPVRRAMSMSFLEIVF